MKWLWRHNGHLWDGTPTLDHLYFAAKLTCSTEPTTGHGRTVIHQIATDVVAWTDDCTHRNASIWDTHWHTAGFIHFTCQHAGVTWHENGTQTDGHIITTSKHIGRPFTRWAARHHGSPLSHLIHLYDSLRCWDGWLHSYRCVVGISIHFDCFLEWKVG